MTPLSPAQAASAGLYTLGSQPASPQHPQAPGPHLAPGAYAPGGYAPQQAYHNALTPLQQQQSYPGQEQGLLMPRVQARGSLTPGLVAMTTSPTPPLPQVMHEKPCSPQDRDPGIWESISGFGVDPFKHYLL